MGMSSEPSGGSDPVAEINVTPMVDVLLSLLIIFMVAQPKPPNENIPLDVPKESPTQMPSDPNATLLVTVNADGTNTIGKTPLSKNYDKMVEQFQQNEKAQKDGKIAIKAEGAVKYGQIVRVMAAAHEAGIADVGLASEKF
jgi:biopolymer transport protein ExbD